MLGTFGDQADHNPCEDTVIAPALPLVVEGLGGAILIRCVTPAHPIAIDEDYAVENATIINARLAMALGKKALNRSICAWVSHKRLLIDQVSL